MLMKVISVAMITLMLCLLLKGSNPQAALAVAASGGVTLLLIIWTPLKELLAQLESLGQEAALPEGYMALILKAIGITLMGELAASLCRETGESALGQKVELACNVLLLTLAMPVLLAVVELLRQWVVL